MKGLDASSNPEKARFSPTLSVVPTGGLSWWFSSHRVNKVIWGPSASRARLRQRLDPPLGDQCRSKKSCNGRELMYLKFQLSFIL